MRPSALALLVLTALCLPAHPAPAAPRQEAAEELDPRVVAAIDALDRAWTGRVEEGIVSAILDQRFVEHPEVVARIAKGLDYRKMGVRRVAVHALGEMELDEARVALEDFWRRSERPRDDADLAERVLKAIAAHESPASIELLARLREHEPPAEGEEPRRDPPNVLRARLLGLGRIRDVRCVRELMRILEGFSVERREESAADFRLALCALTGLDFDQVWKMLEWYRAQEDDLALPEDPAPLPPALRVEWCNYWGFPVDVEMDPEKAERLRQRRGGGR